MALQQTIFLVDDDAAIRRSLTFALEKRGFTVESYGSAQAFLDNYRPEQTGCLLLDLSMPGMSGLELQSHLVECDIMLPIIFITGHGNIPRSKLGPSTFWRNLSARRSFWSESRRR